MSMKQNYMFGKFSIYQGGEIGTTETAKLIFVK
jgi:hypothetical protein